MSKQNETHDVRQLSEIPGIMSCLMTHKAISTVCDFKWTGPKLNTEWPKILAFFKWTYDTTHSESQVRLYVNNRTQEWRAWAFPQKAKLGMSAHEITEGEEGYEKTQQQRVMFNDDEGWTYWGTVHHHCSSSAFQSGVDQANERSQEGLHITVGNLDKQEYDLHFRVYKSGFKLTSVKLSEFWDIGPVIDTVPTLMRPFLNSDWVELITRKQMGVPCPDAEFPQIWRDNVIDVTPKAVVHVQSSLPVNSYTPGSYQFMKKPYLERSQPNFDCDCRKAKGELVSMISLHKNPQYSWEDVLGAVETIHQLMDDDMLTIMDILARNDVTPQGIYEYIVRQQHMEQQAELKQMEQQALIEEARTNGKGKKNKGLVQGQAPHWSDQDYAGYKGFGNDQHMGD